MKIGILSDIHEDAASLAVILHDLERERCDRIVCLGDIMGFDETHSGLRYQPDGEECIRLVKENCSLCVAGNHDLFAARRIPLFAAGVVYPLAWYDLSRDERLTLLNGRVWAYGEWEETRSLSDHACEFLDGLPEFAILDMGKTALHFSHFLFPDLSGSTTRMPEGVPSVWPHLRWMQRQGCMVAFSGHAHTDLPLVGKWYMLHPSGKSAHTVKNTRSWFTCPPVVAGRSRSGFLTFETGTRETRTHYIH